MRRRRMLFVGLALVAAACSSSGGGARTVVGSPVDGPAFIYAAVGASETEGVGTSDPFREAWPRVLWRDALPEAVFHNFGVGGSTAAQALIEQVPEAVATRPDVATVWLNANDLIQGVSPEAYESTLRQVVHDLRRDGRTEVLVANTPHLESLPIYLACRPDPPPGAISCPLEGVTLPPPDAVRAAVDAYNLAIRRVVEAEGAILVDLGAFGDAPAEHPEYISEDGFHPSAAGARVVAQAFADAIPADVARAGGSAS